MGLENRDYLRDEAIRYGEGGGGGFGGGFAGGSEAPICKRILIITIAVFVAQMIVTRHWTEEELLAQREYRLQVRRTLLEDQGVSGDALAEEMAREESKPLKPRVWGLPESESYINEWFALDTSKVLSGQIWRLVSYGFLHSREDVFHILFNMLFLWWFGRRLESLYGSKEFLIFYLCGLAVSATFFVGLDLVSGNPGSAIGASGAVMAVTMLYALHYPRQIIYLFFVIPIEIRWMVLIVAVMESYKVLAVFSGTELFSDNVAHSAHLGGLAFGYLYGKQQWRLSPFIGNLTTWWQAKRRGFKVVRPSVPDSRKTESLKDEMDKILQKISEQGESSLTNAERKTLEKASRELRDRKR